MNFEWDLGLKKCRFIAQEVNLYAKWRNNSMERPAEIDFIPSVLGKKATLNP